MCEDMKFWEHLDNRRPASAQLRVNAAVHASWTVNELLYGKFCEHLGSNVYNGMEAQILRNPTFGTWPFGGQTVPVDGGVAVESDPQRIASQAAVLVRKCGLDELPALLEGYRKGLAFWWLPVGPPDSTRFSPDVFANGNRAQRVEVTGPGEAGLGQCVYMPLHRTRGYQFRVVARAAGKAQLTLRLSAARPDGQTGTEWSANALTIGEDWTVHAGRLRVPPDAPADKLCLLSLTAPEGANVVISRVLLYPDDHVGGADPDVIARLREARLPLLRWPGGNFVSGYHWRDGVGPADQRPARRNPAWATLETNLFGTDEFIAFCRAVGCRPHICVNAGTGTPEEAAAWVEYCNGSVETPMGRLRATHGHPEPYGVEFWEVGNELHGDWQMHWTTPGGYADRYRRFAAAMKQADSAIRLLANGQWPGGPWDRTLIARAAPAGLLRCITHHPLMGGPVDDATDPADLYHAFLAYPDVLADLYRQNCREMAAAGVDEPRQAVTELQLFAHYKGLTEDSGSPGSCPMPTPSTIAESLYDAVFIHALIRCGECIEMLTHSATVNHGGGLRKTRERVWAAPAHWGHVLGLALAGAVPVSVRLECATVSGPAAGNLPAVKDMPVLDAMAALSRDGRDLWLMLVHRAATTGPIRLRVDLAGFAAAESAEVLTLAGQALNDENTPDEPDRIAPVESTALIEDGSAILTLPPFSLTRVRFRAV